MNTILFDKNDFPLTTNVLDFMQSSYAILEKLTALVGGNYILKDCIEVGGSFGPGWVVVNGELMYFTGGSTQAYVRVQTTLQTITVQTGSYDKTTKQLIFGSGTGQILWSTFRRASDLLTMIEDHVHTWSSITGKPGTFPPSEHNHGLLTTVLEIGDWDMDASSSKSVAHGIADFTKIRMVDVMIRIDSELLVIPLNTTWTDGDSHPHGGISQVNSTSIKLDRRTGGIFDSPNYAQTSFNRGWVTIKHIP